MIAVGHDHQLSLRQLLWVCLGLLTAVFVAVSAASIVGRVTVSHAVTHLSERLVPLQHDVEALRRAHTDQETGERGFMLSGNPVSLAPYDAGAAQAELLTARLRDELADDATGTDQLDSVVASAAAWRTQAAEPHIAARRAGAIAPDRQAEMALTGKQLFDRLRGQLRMLGAHTTAMAEAEVQHVAVAQKTANIIQGVGAGVLILVVIGVLVGLQRLLTRPVNTLVGEVKTVADGDYDQPIHRAGPREIAELSDAVEQMRTSLRASTERLIEGELREEQARIAADLHDRVIQRVFGLGLALTSASARRNPDLEPFIDETDTIIRDLREVIFNLNQSTSPLGPSKQLRAAIIEVLESSVSALGFTPALRFDGALDDAYIPPDLHAAVVAVVREALSNVARHSGATAATLSVAVTPEELRLTLCDNGIGVSADDVLGDGRRNFSARAKQFGGAATVDNACPGPGTVVEWAVPLARDNRAAEPLENGRLV